jgi:toxin ParE1/3/4
MSRIELSRAAADDLREIRRYTREHFGPQQAVRIRERFWAVFQTLARAPRIGHQAPDFDPPGKTFRYHPVLGSFVIVYEPTADGIRVTRVLHGARNLLAELERDAGEK